MTALPSLHKCDPEQGDISNARQGAFVAVANIHGCEPVCYDRASTAGTDNSARRHQSMHARPQCPHRHDRQPSAEHTDGLNSRRPYIAAVPDPGHALYGTPDTIEARHGAPEEARHCDLDHDTRGIEHLVDRRWRGQCVVCQDGAIALRKDMATM